MSDAATPREDGASLGTRESLTAVENVAGQTLLAVERDGVSVAVAISEDAGRPALDEAVEAAWDAGDLALLPSVQVADLVDDPGGESGLEPSR